MDCICGTCKRRFKTKSSRLSRFCSAYCRNKDTRKRNKIKLREYYRTYRKSNRINEINRRYRERNKDKVRELTRKYNSLPHRKLLAAQRSKIRRKGDPLFRIAGNLRSRVRTALRQNLKSQTTMNLVGCSIDDLKVHLQNLFTKGMNWENYGQWHVDHIIPCSTFDLNSEKEQRKCFSYKNLQPLWAKDNILKSNKP